MKPSRASSSSKPRARRGKTKLKSATRSTGKRAGATRGRGKPGKSTLKKSGRAAPSTGTQATRSAKGTARAKSNAKTKSAARRPASLAKRGSRKPAQRRRQDQPTQPLTKPIGRKTLPRLGRPGMRTMPTEAPPSPLITALPESSAPKPVDPLVIESRLRAQRMMARAPMMPHGPTAPKPLPPRSGKPVWRRPHSS
jgi:hypothetical protein